MSTNNKEKSNIIIECPETDVDLENDMLVDIMILQVSSLCEQGLYKLAEERLSTLLPNDEAKEFIEDFKREKIFKSSP